MTENLALIATAYMAAIGLISWQSRARLFDSLALAALGACLGSLYLNLLLHPPEPARSAVWPFKNYPGK